MLFELDRRDRDKGFIVHNLTKNKNLSLWFDIVIYYEYMSSFNEILQRLINYRTLKNIFHRMYSFIMICQCKKKKNREEKVLQDVKLTVRIANCLRSFLLIFTATR